MLRLPSDVRLGDREEIGDVGPSSAERIREAALANFAVHGTASTSLRTVAATAGVSLGMVQHHFATKSGLIKAVDDYVVSLVIGGMAQPIPEPPADSIADVGSRVTGLIAKHPDVAAYLSRAMVDGSPLGVTLFDALMDVGMARWELRAERGELRPDVDLTWATINAVDSRWVGSASAPTSTATCPSRSPHPTNFVGGKRPPTTCCVKG